MCVCLGLPLAHFQVEFVPGAWAQEAKGDTPLHIPIRARNLESVQTLSFKSRDKAQHMQNYEGKFPLNLATSRPFREVICKKNQEGDVFTTTIVQSILYVWFFASVSGWVGRIAMCVIPTLKSLGGFLLIVLCRR